MVIARWIFIVAGLIGIFMVIPIFLLEDVYFAKVALGLRHTEFLYGFAAVALAWQVAFIFIGLEPVRLRPIMIPAMLEKFGFAIIAIWLYAIGRLETPIFVAGLIDLVFGLSFVAAWFLTPDAEEHAQPYTSE